MLNMLSINQIIESLTNTEESDYLEFAEMIDREIEMATAAIDLQGCVF